MFRPRVVIRIVPLPRMLRRSRRSRERLRAALVRKGVPR